MANQPKTLEDLFLDALKDTYFAEKKILSALPKMAKAASSDELRTAFEAGENQVALWRQDVAHDAEDFHLEVFQLGPGKHRPPDADHARLDLVERQEGGLGGRRGVEQADRQGGSNEGS